MDSVYILHNVGYTWIVLYEVTML